MKKNFFIVFCAILSVCILIVFKFPKDNSLFNFSSDIVAKHYLPKLINLNIVQNLIYFLMQVSDSLMSLIDNHFSVFPSVIRLYFWEVSAVTIISLIPISLFVSFLYLKNKRVGLVIFAIIAFWLIPFPKIISSQIDSFVIKNKIDVYFPWSNKYVWIGKDNQKDKYVDYRYSWNQKTEVTKNAKINVSCLGHYQLSVNGKRIYHGPTFADLLYVYFDQIDISQYIKKGQNYLDAICIYVDGPTHEYPNYPQNALLVGGKIDDGFLFSHNLADSRFWTYSVMKTISVEDRIFDSGYKEVYDLTKLNNNFQTSQNLNLDYKILPRPLKLLKYENVKPKEISSGVYDLGVFSTGYLTIQTNQGKKCRINTAFGVTLDQNNFPITYVRQEDTFLLPKGPVNYEQISRRSGRYVGISGDCDTSLISVSFSKVYNDFQVSEMHFANSLDKAIFDLAMNSLKNDVQDHVEDSPDRERATYLGDSVQVSKCLLSLGDNDNIVKQTIIQFADAQNDDGSFPSLAPSGFKQLIPSYSLQWTTLLSIYLEKTNDKEFAKQMWPHLEKLISWTENNKSQTGFFYNKHKNKEWWNFFDWTPSSQAIGYQTINQIWYLRTLEISADVAKIIGKDGSENQKRADNLRTNLLHYAYDKENSLFFDSFDENKGDGQSLITNALAGSFGLFPSKTENRRAIEYFNNNYFTDTPYSQSWVVDWLISSGQKDLAKQLIRGYWGGMVSGGGTSVYEKYKPNEYLPDPSLDSFSHAWGCSPVYEYKKINNY